MSDWAVSEARRIIHNNDVDGLRRLLADHPALLSWKATDDDAGLLGMATDSYGDSGNEFNERHFTRKACAELLLDAGAFVAPSVPEGIIRSRAKGLIDLFQHRGLFLPTLKCFAALGDTEKIRGQLDAKVDDLASVNEALMFACHLQQASAAELLLERSIALDPELGRKIDAGPGRAAWVQYFIENKPDVHSPGPFEPWPSFIKQQISRALHDGNLTAFVEGLRREAWLLSDEQVEFQARMIEVAVLNDREELLRAFLDLAPALLHRRPPPPSQAIEFAFTYVKTHLLPLLLRIWPLPDDLPHAAGNGDLEKVKRWFDAAERPTQRVLDTALAWTVLNNRFEVADFLLAHGADINTNWCSHEPASILHELVWHKNYAAMQFLIDRGIDMTIEDYRWHATAEGWARVAAKDEKLGQFLHDAQLRRA